MYLVKLFLQAFHWPKLGHFVADVPGSRVEVSPGSMQLRYCIKCTPIVRNYLRHTRKTSQAVRNVPGLLPRMKRQAYVSQPFIPGGNPTHENVVSGERWGGLVKIRNERGPNTTKYNLTEMNWPIQNKKRLLVAHGNYSSNALRRTNILAIFWGIISRHFRIIYLLHYFPPKPGWETLRNARTFSLFVFCYRTLQ